MPKLAVMPNMTLYLATDHAGFAHKEALKLWLQTKNMKVVDCGAYAHDPLDDYPDYIIKAATAVNDAPDQRRAIIFGGSGQGEAMLANRFAHVRAAVYYGGLEEVVSLSREHNDANILAIGARFVAAEDLPKIVDRWLGAKFNKDKKYARRNKKITFGHCV